MDVSHLVQTVAIYALPVLFAITLHEAAHGYVARHFGDMTAYAQGRISLNPLRHIDPVGTILVPLAILVVTSSRARAASCSAGRSRCRSTTRRCEARAAHDVGRRRGAGANLAMALCWAALFKLGATSARPTMRRRCS